MNNDQVQPPANVANLADELAPLARLAEGQVPATRDDKGRFVTGNNGGGRPKGGKNKLTELFLSVVVADFAEHGAAALARLRTHDPESYLRLVGALIPRELVLQREQEPDVDYAELSDEEIVQVIDAARRRAFIRRALNSV